MTPLDIALDPGEEALGWTLGIGHITAAGLIEGCDHGQLQRFWLEQCTELTHSTAGLLTTVARPVRIWVEDMQVRGGQSLPKTLSKAKALLRLQAIGFGLAGMLAAALGAQVHALPYRTWAGALAEEVVQARVLQRGLTSEEVCALDAKRYRKGIRHNLYDAAGIFLYATGRMRPGMEIHR